MGPLSEAAVAYCMAHTLEQRCIDFAHRTALFEAVLPWVVGAEIVLIAIICLYFRHQQIKQEVL